MPRVSQEHLDARRQQILDAARRCFLRNGFHLTSMQDILSEAGLSAGAVYRYFRSKDDLIVAIAAQAIEGLRDVLQQIFETESPPPLDVAFTRICLAIQRMDAEHGMPRIAVQVWGEAVRSPELAARLREVVTAIRSLAIQLVRLYQERGEISPDVPAEEVGPVLLGLLPGFMLQHILFGDVDAHMVGRAVRGLVAGHPVSDDEPTRPHGRSG
jgi:AcrR family transcriptional regulator